MFNDMNALAVNFVLHIVNAVILFLILRKLLFKPVKGYMDKRTQGFTEQKENLDNRQEEIEHLETEFNHKMDNARGEAKKIMDQANERANEHMDEAKQKAKEQVRIMIDRGRKQIESERAKAMEDIKGQAADLAVEIASKILAREIKKDDHQKIIEDFLERVK
jgi:F-type H+-transporting ATPase subunit b